jgi:hypothetical protein
MNRPIVSSSNGAGMSTHSVRNPRLDDRRQALGSQLRRAAQ